MLHALIVALEGDMARVDAARLRRVKMGEDRSMLEICSMARDEDDYLNLISLRVEDRDLIYCYLHLINDLLSPPSTFHYLNALLSSTLTYSKRTPHIHADFSIPTKTLSQFKHFHA